MMHQHCILLLRARNERQLPSSLHLPADSTLLCTCFAPTCRAHTSRNITFAAHHGLFLSLPAVQCPLYFDDCRCAQLDEHTVQSCFQHPSCRPHTLPIHLASVRTRYCGLNDCLTITLMRETTALNGEWSTFWTGAITGWCGIANVDGVAYTFLGIAVVADVRGLELKDLLRYTNRTRC
jgi:hypothetical protein